MAGKYWDTGVTLVQGCTRVSPACDNCWALAMERRYKKDSTARFMPERLERFKRNLGVVSIWNDLFHHRVKDAEIYSTLSFMRRTPQNFYLILTKRVGRMANVVQDNFGEFPNAMFGCTTETQKEYDERMPLLIQMVDKNLFISIEPILGGIEDRYRWIENLKWVICGAETGPGARPVEHLWVKRIWEQCKDANVPLFVKKWPNGEIIQEYPEAIQQFRRKK